MGSGTSAEGWAIAVTLLLVLAAITASWVRAWRCLRQTRIIINDIKPEIGMPAEAILGLSPQLREKVRQELRRQGHVAYEAEKATLDADIKARLMTIRDAATGRADAELNPTMLKSMSEMLVHDARHSISELFEGLGAAGPPEMQGLISVLGSNLPAQEGWSVRSYPVLRGVGGTAEAGLTLELSEAGGAADEVTTFWDTSEALRASASGTAEEVAAIRQVLHGLLRPAALWVAIRLVARNLTQRRDSKSGMSRIFRRHAKKLTGLQWQIAGQMSLYATRSQERFALGFARQALEDLERAEIRLPDYYRPPMMRGSAYERKGWAHRRAGDAAAAERAFTAAIRAYDRAEARLRACEDPGVDASRRDKEVEAIAVRRAKCRLLSGDGRHAHRASEELAQYLPLRDAGQIALYNAACAFAAAMESEHLSDAERAKYEREAWQHLGRSLLAGGQDDRAWMRVKADEELTGLPEPQLAAFCAEISKRHDGARPLTGAPARLLVNEAMMAIGLAPPVRDVTR